MAMGIITKDSSIFVNDLPKVINSPVGTDLMKHGDTDYDNDKSTDIVKDSEKA